MSRTIHKGKKESLLVTIPIYWVLTCILGVLQLYQVGIMDLLFTKEVTKGQRGTCSRTCSYRAVDLVFTHAVFQIAPWGPVSKAVPSDGIPRGKIDPLLYDRFFCGLCSPWLCSFPGHARLPSCPCHFRSINMPAQQST